MMDRLLKDVGSRGFVWCGLVGFGAVVSMPARPLRAQASAVQQCAQAVARAAANAVDTVVVDDDAPESAQPRGPADMSRARHRAMQAVAARCVTSINPSSLSPEQLAQYATLQLNAGQTDAALATVRRFVAASGDVVGRWGALQSWMVLNEPYAPSIAANTQFVTLARWLVAMADSTHTMPARVSSRVVFARALRQVDSMQVYRVAQQVVDLIRAMPVSERESVAGPAAAMVQDIGEWSTADHAPSAGVELAIQAGALWPNPSSLIQQLPNALPRLARIGTKASTLPVTQWINTANNGPVSMADGQVTIVAFSSVTCRACKYTYQPMDSMYRRLRSRGLQVVLSVPVSEGGRDPAAGWRTVLSPFNVSYPVALTQINDLSALYPLHVWPAFVLIDRRGIVRDLWEGWNGSEDLEQRVERVLGDPVSNRASGAE